MRKSGQRPRRPRFSETSGRQEASCVGSKSARAAAGSPALPRPSPQVCLRRRGGQWRHAALAQQGRAQRAAANIRQARRAQADAAAARGTWRLARRDERKLLGGWRQRILACWCVGGVMRVVVRARRARARGAGARRRTRRRPRAPPHPAARRARAQGPGRGVAALRNQSRHRPLRHPALGPRPRPYTCATSPDPSSLRSLDPGRD